MSALLCTFTLDGERFGVPAELVSEVILHHASTPVPLADPHISGLINLRGNVVCVIDLRKRLGRSPADASVGIVVQHSAGTAALLVDDIDDVEHIEDYALDPVPANVDAATRDLLVGVHRTDHQILAVLDVERVVKGDNQ